MIKFNHSMNKLDVYGEWRNYLRERSMKTSADFMKILKSNYECLLSRKKRKYPPLPFRATSTGDARYHSKDLESFFSALLIQLMKAEEASALVV